MGAGSPRPARLPPPKGYRQNSARLIPGLRGVRKLAAGYAHASALLADGTVMAWGENFAGQLGTGTTSRSYRPLPVAGQVSAALDLAHGRYHALILTATQRIKATGGNDEGQLGLGDTERRLEPTLNPDLDQVTAIASHWHTSYAVRRDRTVWGWGNCENYLLRQDVGPPTDPSSYSAVPLQIPDVTGGPRHRQRRRTSARAALA